MKRHIGISLFIICLLCGAADQIKQRIEPRPVTVGEPAELVLTVEGSKAPVFSKVPKVGGLEWLGSGSSVQTRIINGHYTGSAERRYSFIVEKPGTYTIPAAEVSVNGKNVLSEPISFTAENATLRTGRSSRAAQEELDIGKVAFSEFKLPSAGKTYYTGEYIPVEVVVYCLSGVKLNLSYPEISAEKDNIVFRNYKSENPQNPSFERPSTFVVRRDRTEYICYRFRTEICTLSAGELKLSSRTPVQIQIPSSPSGRSSRDPFFDDFFDSGFFARTVRHTARSTSETISIKAIPAPPERENWLGLVGSWRITPNVSSRETTVGNAVTLTLRISGNGGLENLRAPEITNDGFRVYSPEIIRNPDGMTAEIKYIMIPVRTGTCEISQKFCVFNTVSGKFETTDVSASVKVGEETAVIHTQKKPNVVDTALPEPEIRKKPEHSLAGIMYLKRLEQDSGSGNTPVCWAVFFCLLGIALFIFCEIAAKRRKSRGNGSERKAAARKSKKKLLDQLKKSSPEQIYSMTPAVAEYLNNAINLPPGTSLDEIADKMDPVNPELSRQLHDLSAGAWAPGSAGFTEERKRSLMKNLGKIICLAVCFSCVSLPAAPSGGEDSAMQAYDKGNFKDAREWYSSRLKTDSPPSSVLYNIGNCFYQEKQFAKALACYERALLLAPRDKEIQRNLNLARRELGLPAKFVLETPADFPAFLRDGMTPGEWILLAAIGFCLLLTGCGLRRFAGFRTVFSIGTIGGILLILGVSMAVCAKMTTCADDRGIVLGNNVFLRNLPSENSANIGTETLRAGEDVSIREKRKNWTRIKAGNAIGWVPASDVEAVSGTDFSVR